MSAAATGTACHDRRRAMVPGSSAARTPRSRPAKPGHYLLRHDRNRTVVGQHDVLYPEEISVSATERQTAGSQVSDPHTLQICRSSGQTLGAWRQRGPSGHPWASEAPNSRMRTRAKRRRGKCLVVAGFGVEPPIGDRKACRRHRLTRSVGDLNQSHVCKSGRKPHISHPASALWPASPPYGPGSWEVRWQDLSLRLCPRSGREIVRCARDTRLWPPLASVARGAVEAAAGCRCNPGTDGRRSRGR